MNYRLRTLAAILPLAPIPNCSQARGKNAPIAAEHRDAKMDCGGRNHLIRHVRDLGARYLPHGVNNCGGQGGLRKCRMGIGNRGKHRKSSPKPRNISARFSSISSADGAGPYLERMPRPVANGGRDGCVSSVDANQRPSRESFLPWTNRQSYPQQVAIQSPNPSPRATG